MQVATAGLDLAKNIFQVHGIAPEGNIVFNRPHRRPQVLSFFERLEPCLIGIEAFGTSHCRARELTRLGHDVRLMPPMHVKPYVKRGKSDAIDAAAICEAVTRPSMRFVEVKSTDQRALLSLHRARDLIVRQRTQLINALRSLLAEFGVCIARGLARVNSFAEGVVEGTDLGLPSVAQDVIRNLSQQLRTLHSQVRWQEAGGRAAAGSQTRCAGSVVADHPGCRRGDGFGDCCSHWWWPSVQKRPRIRRVARPDACQQVERRKERLGRITKMGGQYLRQLLVVGMTSLVRQTRSHPNRASKWPTALLERKPARVAAVAMTNKTARILEPPRVFRRLHLLIRMKPQ